MEIVDVLSLYKTPNKHICSVLEQTGMLVGNFEFNP